MTETTQQRRLERDGDNVLVAGVLSGLARYFMVDVVWVRLAAVVGFICTGLFPGLFLYLGAWLVMPVGSGKAAEPVTYRVVE